MVRAAATGALDFSEADPYDPRWMIKLRLVLAELLRQSSLNFATVLHSHYVNFTTIPRLEEASFTKLRNGANDSLDIVIQQSEPWNKEQAEKATKDKVHAAVQEWEDHYGKLDDPGVQEAIAATVAAVKRHRVEEEIKRKAQEAIWKGQRRGTRRERHSGTKRPATRRT